MIVVKQGNRGFSSVDSANIIQHDDRYVIETDDGIVLGEYRSRFQARSVIDDLGEIIAAGRWRQPYYMPADNNVEISGATTAKY